MICDHCPVKCGKPCIADRFNASNLCDKVNPAHTDYNPKAAQLISDKSCGTQEYKIVAKQGGEPKLKLEQHQMPSLWQQMKNLTGSMIHYAKNGFGNVSEEEYTKRIAICEGCEFFEKNHRRCFRCGCFVDGKAKLSSEICPENKWAISSSTPAEPAEDCGCNK